MPADHDAAQDQECLVNVRTLFKANAQPPVLMEPRVRTLYDPSSRAQTATMYCLAPADEGDNVSLLDLASMRI